MRSSNREGGKGLGEGNSRGEVKHTARDPAPYRSGLPDTIPCLPHLCSEVTTSRGLNNLSASVVSLDPKPES